MTWWAWLLIGIVIGLAIAFAVVWWALGELKNANFGLWR